VLLSRFSDHWDRSGLNEPTIAFTRTRSSASARADDRMRGIAITPIGAGARVLAVASDRAEQASRVIAPGESSRAPRLARRPIGRSERRQCSRATSADRIAKAIVPVSDIA
jgi:N-acyl-D-aspartate/D-glutamate deacylase